MGLRSHIEQILPKFNSACSAVRFIYQFSNVDTLKVMYFAYFYSIMDYGIIFCGNSTKGHSVTEEIYEKCDGGKIRSKLVFRALEIMALLSQYILSSMTYIANNREYFSLKFSIRGINTRNKLQLHRPIANLT